MGKKLDTESIDEYIINNYPAKKTDKIANDLHISSTTVCYRIKELKKKNIITEQPPDKHQLELYQQRKKWATYSNNRPYDDYK